MTTDRPSIQKSVFGSRPTGFAGITNYSNPHINGVVTKRYHSNHGKMHNAFGDSLIHLRSCGVRPIGIGKKHQQKLAEWEACNNEIRSAIKDKKIDRIEPEAGVTIPDLATPPLVDMPKTVNTPVAPIDYTIKSDTTNMSKILKYSLVGVAIIAGGFLLIKILNKK